jgi:DNA repair protein RecO (recombination protein O)
VLHVRPYRETSSIVQLFTRDAGRVAGVVRGARRKHGTNVQPFTFGMLVYTGRSTLVTVTKFDPAGRFDLHGDALVAGFYVLELVARLLDERQAEPVIFDATHEVLARLTAGADVQASLRPYELTLLRELGYGIDFGAAADSGEPIQPAKTYGFQPDVGFVSASDEQATATDHGRREVYLGEHLQAISRGDFSDEQAARAAKRIVRAALAPLLGDKPLVSRKMLSASHR